MSDHEKPIRVPACTNCVRRKTKCDRNSPCSSCVAAKSQCRYVQQRQEKKRRVLHSTRYEESLSSIRHQLEALSNTLQSLVENSEGLNGRRSSNDGSNSTPTTVHTVPEPLNGKENAGVHDQRDYEGDSSFYSQTKKITDTLSLAASSTPDSGTNAQVTAVGVVQSLIQDAKIADSPPFDDGSSQSSSTAFSQYPELAGLSLPPMDAVLRILAFAKTTPQRYFMLPHTDPDDFAELCQKLYFPTQPFTIFAWIIVNCGLSYLFRDLHKTHRDLLRLTKAQASDAVNICFRNIDRAVMSLRLCVNPSFEAVIALVSAGSINMEGAKGSLAWRLMSAAARMTIDLGYHRLPSGYGDQERSRQRKLFWYVYAMDKSLAFNYGRSSTIQDYDVTTDRPLPSEDFKGNSWFIFLGYADFAAIQYQIYEKLFSARAQQGSDSTRTRRVHEFEAKLAQIRDTFAILDQKDVIFRGTDISLSSVLTLVYRALPPENSSDAHSTTQDENSPLRFHSACVEAGRKALNTLVSGWYEVSNEQDEEIANGLINWTLHHVPFMPFIAVFGNQIATGNQEDLILLQNVVKIVKIAVNDNVALNKMHKAFSRLLKIAELWTSTKNVNEQRQDPNLRAQPVTDFTQASHSTASNELNPPDGFVSDVNMSDPTATDFSMTSWQDLDMANQDWDVMFNEFDLGLGAESAREMMPWFEQHLSGSNTLS